MKKIIKYLPQLAVFIIEALLIWVLAYGKVKDNPKKFITDHPLFTTLLSMYVFLLAISFLSSVYFTFQSTTMEDSTELDYTYSKITTGSWNFLIPKFSFLLSPCSATMTYDIGEIGEDMIKSGFDRDRLLSIIQESEKVWENAGGFNFFEYKSGTSNNLINFLTSSPNKPEGTMRGSLGLFYPRFDIFIYVDTEPDIKENLLHEMGHAIGLPHLPQGEGAVMSPYSVRQTSNSLNLSAQDISLLREFCGGRIRSIYR